MTTLQAPLSIHFSKTRNRHEDFQQAEPISYFGNLQQRFSQGLEFRENWKAIADIQATPQDLVHVLDQIAQFLLSPENRDLSQQCAFYLSRNIDCWEKAAQDQIQDFTLQNIIICMEVLGNLKIRPSAEFIVKMEMQALILMKSSPEAERNTYLHSLLKSYAQIGVQPSQPLLNQWEHIITSQWESTVLKSTSLKALEFGNIIWAYATLSLCPPPQLAGSLKEGASALAGIFKPGHLINNIRACAILDCISEGEESAWKNIASTLHHHVKLEHLTSDTRKSHLRLASLWFGWPYEIAPEKETDKSSKLEDKLRDLLEDKGFKITADAIVPTMNHKVDIPLKQDGCVVWIEIDGPSHFKYKIGPSGEYILIGYDGPTLFQTTLMERYMPAGTSIIRIPYDVLEKLLYEKEGCLALEDLLMPPAGETGTYTIDYSRSGRIRRFAFSAASAQNNSCHAGLESIGPSLQPASMCA